jgi:hypothetical protein
VAAPRNRCPSWARRQVPGRQNLRRSSGQPIRCFFRSQFVIRYQV